MELTDNERLECAKRVLKTFQKRKKLFPGLRNIYDYMIVTQRKHIKQLERMKTNG